MRGRMAVLILVLALAGCAGSQTSSNEERGRTNPTGPVSQYAPTRVRAGTAVNLTHDVDAGVVLLDSPRVIDPPEFWGDEKITIANVTITATKGRLEFAETAFILVAGD